MNSNPKTFRIAINVAFGIAFNFSLMAQDILSTTDGDVTINPVLHGSLVLQWDDYTIFVDPYGGAELYEKFDDPHLILITDIHGDHWHESTIAGLTYQKATFIVPKAVYDLMKEDMKTQSIVVANGEKTDFHSLEVEALPMYNLPETADSRHPKGRGNGYTLSVGGKKIYISGDTEDIEEMRALDAIDVAFVCMNLPYTMSVEQAASAVNQFKPAVVYPFHYRGKDGLADLDRFQMLVQEGIEVRIRDWYPH